MTYLQNSNGVRRTCGIYRVKTHVIDPVATDDVKGQVKVEVFDDLSCLVLSRTKTENMEICQIERSQ